MHKLLMVLSAAATAMALSASGAGASWFPFNTARLDLIAGPAGMGAIISTDGTRILHLGKGSRTCMLSLDNLDVRELACKQDTYETRPRVAEDMFWSPDSKHLVMPTYIQAFMEFRDTDIRIFDPETLEVTNLTDDGVDGGLLHPLGDTADVDHSARWLDDDTIAFLRYTVPKEGLSSRGSTSLMTVDLGGEATPLAKLAPAAAGLISTLAASPDGQRFAYAIDAQDGAKGGGLYLVGLADRKPHLILPAAEIGTPLTSVTFSADGNYLLLISTRSQDIEPRVLDPGSGAVLPVGEGHVTGVAWSPVGSALAYIVNDTDNPGGNGGLYVSDAPGHPGDLMVAGKFMPPICCGRFPFAWASDNTLLLGRTEDMETVLLVTLNGP